MKGIVKRSDNSEPFDSDSLPSNADLKKLLENTLTRFENWKLEVERNPNPRMVHTLKNIISIIDSIAEINKTRMRYSYKSLSRQMSILIDEVAKLNLTITDSLMEDDFIDAKEEKKINESLRNVIKAAIKLITIVQDAFGAHKPLSVNERVALPDQSNQTASETISPISDVE